MDAIAQAVENEGQLAVCVTMCTDQLKRQNADVQRHKAASLTDNARIDPNTRIERVIWESMKVWIELHRNSNRTLRTANSPASSGKPKPLAQRQVESNG